MKIMGKEILNNIIYNLEEDKETEKRDKLYERIEREQDFTQLGIPKRYWKARLDYKSKVCEYIKRFIAEKGKSLVISGGVGCGKTSGVCAYLMQQREGIFIDISELKGAVFRNDYDLLYRVKICQVLVLDDLGMEFEDSKGFFPSVIDEVFNARYSNDLTTLVTTNLTFKQFKERYGKRVVDRMKEWGRFVETKEGSLRQKKIE